MLSEEFLVSKASKHLLFQQEIMLHTVACSITAVMVLAFV